MVCQSAWACELALRLASWLGAPLQLCIDNCQSIRHRRSTVQSRASTPPVAAPPHRRYNSPLHLGSHYRDRVCLHPAGFRKCRHIHIPPGRSRRSSARRLERLRRNLCWYRFSTSPGVPLQLCIDNCQSIGHHPPKARSRASTPPVAAPQSRTSNSPLDFGSH